MRRSRQRGIALLVAIVIFAVATLLAAAITYSKAMTARRAAATYTMEEALQAGMAFSNTKTALAHSISYDMTLRHGLPHGIACSFTLPAVMRLAIGRRPDRDAVLARVFDGDIANAPGKLTAFLHDLGVATEFSAYGVSETESSAMIAAALDGPRGRNFIGAAA